MDQWLEILLIIGGIVLSISILYAVIAYQNTIKTILKTIPAPAAATEEVIAYYYLPAPLIKITATAKVEIRSESESFKDAVLKELSLLAIQETFPDTSRLLLLQYTSSSFAND